MDVMPSIPAPNAAQTAPSPGPESLAPQGVAGRAAPEPRAAQPERATSPLPIATPREAMQPASVQLSIENLVLHGFPAGDRYRIGEAVEHELSRLLRENGIPGTMAEGGALDRIDAGEFQIGGGMRPAEIGARIARAIYGGLRR